MKISYNWLKQFLNLDWNVERTAELLTDLGLEVEGITPFESVKGGLKGIVVGHVLECEKHPNADRLKLTQVDIGNGEPLQIVCGAPNVEKGQKVPVATIGTTLYTAEGEAWKIKKGKIRGEESQGMICAEDELGLGTDHDGIMVLDAKLKPGTPCGQLFEIENDHTLEIGLTPNRADAMSHYGVARDLKAGLEQNDVSLKLITPSTSNFSVDNRMLKMDVSVENSNLAPRYCGLTIDGIKVGESPSWLQNRLKAIGLAPINNVVDITNYVLHDLGQPLHAFDADRIHDKKIIVKTLPSKTKFVTLDGVERELHEDDLMICDGEKPMCIAGVFGGIYSGVIDTTTSIFLESAYFDPISIRKTAKRHGLNTDASFRFERGIDITLCEEALKRAAILIKEICGGQITSEIVDLYPNKKEDLQVFLTFDKINKLVGQEIPRETIKSILASLEIKVNNVTESGLGLTIPSYRNDVTREVDVIEEILRVYGYNKIEFKEKFIASVAKTNTVENHLLQDSIGDFLAANGFYEIMTNSLTEGKNEDGFITMLNPLSNDLSALRQSLLRTGLQTISHNINRKNSDLRMFEFGKTYHKSQKGYEEHEHLMLFMTGDVDEESWTTKTRPTNFFFIKGIVHAILERLGIEQVTEESKEDGTLAEGLSLYKGKTELVSLGAVHKKILAEFDVKSAVYTARFNWNAILNLVKNNRITFEALPKFPEVRRDFALLLDENVSYEALKSLAFRTEKNLLKKVNLFDVYTGKNLPEGKKSYALSFTLLDEQKTLTDKQIDKAMDKLKKAFEKEFEAQLR